MTIENKVIHEEIWEIGPTQSMMIDGAIREYPVTKIKNGTNIMVRENIYKELIGNEELQKDFQLNIKRLSRWYWSIYFKSLKS